MYVLEGYTPMHEEQGSKSTIAPFF